LIHAEISFPAMLEGLLKKLYPKMANGRIFFSNNAKKNTKSALFFKQFASREKKNILIINK